MIKLLELIENEKQKGADKAEKRRDALQRDGQSP